MKLSLYRGVITSYCNSHLPTARYNESLQRPFSSLNNRNTPTKVQTNLASSLSLGLHCRIQSRQLYFDALVLLSRDLMWCLGCCGHYEAQKMNIFANYYNVLLSITIYCYKELQNAGHNIPDITRSSAAATMRRFNAANCNARRSSTAS